MPRKLVPSCNTGWESGSKVVLALDCALIAFFVAASFAIASLVVASFVVLCSLNKLRDRIIFGIFCSDIPNPLLHEFYACSLLISKSNKVRFYSCALLALYWPSLILPMLIPIHLC